MPGQTFGRTAFVLAGGGSFGDAIEIAVVPPLCRLDVSPYDFTRAGELIDRAAASTRQWIDEGGLARRDIPHQLRHHLHPRAGR